MCLLTKSWLNIKNPSKALITLMTYLEEKGHFLEDMRDIYFLAGGKQDFKKNGDEIINLKINPESIQIDEKVHGSFAVIREFALKKVSLLACIANLMHIMR